MKRKLIITAAILAAITTEAVAIKAHTFLNVRYTDSALPNVCLYPGSRPADCTQTASGIVCTVDAGSHTYTYYQFSTCVTPWYRAE